MSDAYWTARQMLDGPVDGFSRDAWHDALAELVDALGADAQLGSALVEALRETERDRRTLSIWHGSMNWQVQQLNALGRNVPSEATRRLSALLAAFPQEDSRG